MILQGINYALFVHNFEAEFRHCSFSFCLNFYIIKVLQIIILCYKNVSTIALITVWTFITSTIFPIVSCGTNTADPRLAVHFSSRQVEAMLAVIDLD